MSVEGWKTAPFGSIAEVIDPHPSHRAPAELKDGIPFPGIGDFHEDGSINFSSCRFVAAKVFEEHNARYTIQVGDIGFGRVASIGKVVQLRPDLLPYTISPTLAIIKPKGINPNYLIEFLRSPQLEEQIRSLLTGTTRSSLGIELLRKLIISFPESDEQLIIGRILATINHAIKQTEALIAKQQRIKTGMMQDLLTKGIDEDGNMRSEGTHAFKDSPLGRIPVEWEVKNLGYALVSIDAGKSPNCPDIPATGDEWGVLKVSAVHPLGFRSKENKVIIDLSYINPNYEVRDGDFLITRANTFELVGLTCLVKNPPSRLLISDKTLRLNVNKNIALTEFVFYATQMSFVRVQIEIHATGSSAGMKNITQQIIRNIQIPLPKVKEQKQIAKLLAIPLSQINAETVYLNKLQRQKTGLMQDLLTGKVRVTDLLDQTTTLT